MFYRKKSKRNNLERTTEKKSGLYDCYSNPLNASDYRVNIFNHTSV